MKNVLYTATAIITLLTSLSAYESKKSPYISNIHTARSQDTFLETGWYFVTDSTNKNGVKKKLDRSDLWFYIDRRTLISKTQVISTEIYLNRENKYALGMKFDSSASSLWEDVTYKAHINNERLALIVNDTLLLAATVYGMISNGVSALNRGIYSKEELEHFQKVFEN